MHAKKHDVIQANENAGEWAGCLLIVTQEKPWGVVAGMRVPNQGIAYIRLSHNQYERIGTAVLVEEEDDD